MDLGYQITSARNLVGSLLSTTTSFGGFGFSTTIDGRTHKVSCTLYQIPKSNLRYVLFMVFVWSLTWFLGCSAIEDVRFSSHDDPLGSYTYQGHVDSFPIPSSHFFRGSPMGHGVYPLNSTILEQPTTLETDVVPRTTFDVTWIYQGILGEFNGISDVFGAGMITIGSNLIFHNGISVFALDIQTGMVQWEIDFSPYIESRSLIELYRVSVPVIFQHKIYLTFGTHLFSIEPDLGTYEKLATWQEYFYETGVLLWEQRLFAMDMFGTILEYDPIGRDFLVWFFGHRVQDFQDVPLTWFRDNLEHRPQVVSEQETQSEVNTSSSGSRFSQERTQQLSQQRIHPFAGPRIDNPFREFSTYSFFLQSEEYLIGISPSVGRMVLVPKNQIINQSDSLTSTEHSPIIPYQGFSFSGVVTQLPGIYQLANQEILVIPFVADLGTQEHTVLIGFSLTDKEIRWETKIDGFQVAPMVMVQDQVIVPTVRGIKSLSLENGDILWHQTFEGILSASGIKHLDHSTLYVVITTHNRLVVFDGVLDNHITSVELDEFLNPPDSFITSDGVLGHGSNLIVRIGSRIMVLE